MNDLYVGVVENPVSDQALVVAVGFTLNGTQELTEKWIKEQGDPEAQYKIRLYEINEAYIDTGDETSKLTKQSAELKDSMQHLGQTPEEQILKNRPALDWAADQLKRRRKTNNVIGLVSDRVQPQNSSLFCTTRRNIKILHNIKIMDNLTESNNRELLFGALERLLRETDHQNWSLITEIGYNLSEESRRQLVADAIASLKSLPELSTFFQPKTHNVQCPVDRCGSLLPIQERDRGIVLCTCRNYYLCIHWEDGDVIVGSLHPAVKKG